MSVEPVRLVIWDLDETFWKGTLTEGGIEYSEANHQTVIELARRGIMSSICSRNDRDTVEKLLREKGIWDYFIFPSIDWSAKGPRLKALVEAVQLRAPTVLFIDDNPMNLGEAAHFLPDLQVADEKSVPDLLANPLLRGKDDSGLTRLKQYKLLEERHADQTNAGGNTDEFLRTSNIRVFIDHDIEGNLDRAIELINRTNQLNFTKKRLPEDPKAARTVLAALLAKPTVHGGLVGVCDRYGDYGYVGIYIGRKAIIGGSSLLHYCFSCRTLGMLVEKWLYEQLGRPDIEIVGEVLTDIMDTSSAPIDWIRLGELNDADAPTKGNGAMHDVARIVMRGGCEMLAMSHYFELAARSVAEESAFNRDGIQIRIEHSLFVRHALDGLSKEALEAFGRLGYRPEDFQTKLVAGSGEPEVWMLGFWGEPDLAVYRHRELGLRIPFSALPAVKGATRNAEDLTQAGRDRVEPAFQDHWIVSALETLKAEYEYEGRLAPELCRENIESILDQLPENAIAFVLGTLETRRHPRHDQLVPVKSHIVFNNLCREILAPYDRVFFLNAADFILDEDDIGPGMNHLHRKVYFRIYEHVTRQIAEWRAQQAAAPQKLEVAVS